VTATPYLASADWDALIDEHDQLTPSERREMQFSADHLLPGVRTRHKVPIAGKSLPIPALKPTVPQKPAKPPISAADVRPLLEALSDLLRQIDEAWIKGRPVKMLWQRARELRYTIEEVLK